MKKILINSKEEMANFAKEIAASSKFGDIFCLDGTLGAGKSFFANIL
jgi:tRNA A37 threonylcarbamoyladenosine biosynthesis protein TsaE